MSENFHYDVFLSHSSKDKPIVRELAERLRSDGVRVWLDEWIIKPGDSIPIKVSQGLEQSRILVLAISANASESDWVEFEHQTVLFNDPTNKKRRFIPLKIDDSESKFHLKQFAYIDWRKRDEEREYQRLLSSIFEHKDETDATEIYDRVVAEINSVRVYKEDQGSIYSIAISSNGKYMVSGFSSGVICVWDLESGRCINTLKGHFNLVNGVTITPNGEFIVSGSSDDTIRIWDLVSGNCIKILEGHHNLIKPVAITPDGKHIVSGSLNEIYIWDLASGRLLKSLVVDFYLVHSIAITPNGKQIVVGCWDNTIRIYNLTSERWVKTLEGHFDSVNGVAITPDGKQIVSGSKDETIKVWDLESGRCINTLKGHVKSVHIVAITPNGKHIVSGSFDHTLRVWDLASGNCLAILRGHTNYIDAGAITPDGKHIVSGSRDGSMRVWNISDIAERGKTTSIENIIKTGSFPQIKGIQDSEDFQEYEFYTNAKVLLVGDSGVGKSGLAHRLINNEFVETISTDGVWATQLKLEHDANTADTEREIWLWDFAGQSDYRLIHQLFMDETSLAVLVFNPQNDNPFEGLGQWDRDLQKAARRPFNKLLVAGRCDRGGMIVSQKTLDDFKDAREFAKYLETSALTGDGCHDLRQAIIEHINWDDIPHRTSPRIFKLLKVEIIKIKDEGKILLRLSELKQNLEMRLPNERFSFDELKTVVGLLAGSGVVWQLDFGDFVLLQPERINS